MKQYRPFFHFTTVYRLAAVGCLTVVLTAGCAGYGTPSAQKDANASAPAEKAVATAASSIAIDQVQTRLPAKAPIKARWALNLQGSKVKRVWIPPIALNYQYMLIMTTDHELLAIHRRNGKTLWSTKAQEQLTGEPFFTEFGIYMIVHSYLISIERYSGETIWRTLLSFPPAAGPVVHEETERLPIAYIPGLDQKVYAVEIEMITWPPKTGAGGVYREKFQYQKPVSRIVWRYPAFNGIAGGLAYAGRRVYLNDSKDRVYAITTTDLTMGKPDQIAYYRTQGAMSVGPTIIGQYILVASRDHNLYCLHKRDLSRIWKYASGHILDDAPYMMTDPHTNRTTVIQRCGATGPLVGLSDVDGKQSWSLQGASQVVGLFSEMENELNKRAIMVIQNKDKTISGHFALNGEELWRIAKTPFSQVFQNTSDNLIYATIADGTIICALAKRE